MKNFILLAALIYGLTANAANFGKFKLTVETGYYDGEEVVFLMNTSGEIKMLENDSYYTIKPQFFFGKNTLLIESGGDDDKVEGIIHLENNKATDACAVLLSLSNKAGELLWPKGFKLDRWNKFSKRYESVYPQNFSFSEKCESELLADYQDFSIF
jgi:hypothetical protein